MVRGGWPLGCGAPMQGARGPSIDPPVYIYVYTYTYTHPALGIDSLICPMPLFKWATRPKPTPLQCNSGNPKGGGGAVEARAPESCRDSKNVPLIMAHDPSLDLGGTDFKPAANIVALKNMHKWQFHVPNCCILSCALMYFPSDLVGRYPIESDSSPSHVDSSSCIGSLA